MGEVKGPTVQYSANSPSWSDQAGRIGEAAKHRVAEQVDAKKGAIVSRIESVAEVLEDAARTLEDKVPGAQKWATQAADRVRGFGDSIDGKNAQELFRVAQSAYRTNPVPILLGCVALGFIGARLFREALP